jgi:hypothetical protein
MKPGFQWRKDLEGKTFTIWFTGHFVERFEVDLPDRPAAKRSIPEEAVKTAIEQALESIVDISFGDPDAVGVIYAQSRHFIMTWTLRARADGFQVNLTTVKPGLDFKARSAKDYEIKVNPEYLVSFIPDLSPALKAAVLQDLAGSIPEMEDGTLYHRTDPDVVIDYWAEKRRTRLEVTDASWAADTYEVYVP